MGDSIASYLPSSYPTLWVVEVGSRMWKMARDDIHGMSDHDLVVIYAMSTKDLLSCPEQYKSNLPCNHGVMINGEEFDFSYMEIGHLIHLLKKGNCNAIWSVMSDIVIQTSEIHDQIKGLIRSNPSKAILPSVRGLVASNLSDVEKRYTVYSPEKSLMSALRTIKWATSVIGIGDFGFFPVAETNRDGVLTALSTLREVEGSSHIPLSMPVKDLEDILFDFRIDLL